MPRKLRQKEKSGELWVPRCIQEVANLFFWRISILADTGSALVMETRFLGTSPLASPACTLLVWVSWVHSGPTWTEGCAEVQRGRPAGQPFLTAVLSSPQSLWSQLLWMCPLELQSASLRASESAGEGRAADARSGRERKPHIQREVLRRVSRNLSKIPKSPSF